MAEGPDENVLEQWRRMHRRNHAEQRLKYLRLDPALPPDHPLRRLADADAVEWLLKQEEEGK